MRPNIQISHQLNGRVKDYAAANDLTVPEAYQEIIKTGLDHLDNGSQGMTIETKYGESYDVEGMIKRVVRKDTPKSQTASFWWSDEVSVQFGSMHPDADLEILVEVINTDEIDIESLESASDVPLDGFSELMGLLTEAASRAVGVEPEFELLAKGTNARGVRRAIFEAKVEEIHLD